MIVVADASPLQYLVLIEHVDVLPSLFGTIGVPPAVLSELSHPVAPEAVRRWAVNKPDWLLIRVPRETLVAAHGTLGAREREAIALAVELSADALLMDDRDGRREAEKRNLTVFGTLRVLADASHLGLLALPVALDRLMRTNFRATEQLMRHLRALSGG